jgi:hypothetical protein
VATVNPVFPFNIVCVLFLLVSYSSFRKINCFIQYMVTTLKDVTVQHEMAYGKVYWLKKDFILFETLTFKLCAVSFECET